MFVSDLGMVSEQILQMFFPYQRLSPWLAAVKFILKGSIFPLFSFTLYHAILNCLSLIEFLINLYGFECVQIVCLFVFFFGGVYVELFDMYVGIFWIPFLRKHYIFVITFFLTTSKSDVTRNFSLSLVGMHFAAASIWAVTKFSYPSFGNVYFRWLLKNISNLFLLVAVDLLLIFLLVKN